MNSIEVASFAKINLSIDLLGRYENGYHEVKMVMHQLKLHDDVTVNWEEGDGRDISVQTDMPGLSSGPDNLAWRAADLMFDRYGRTGKVSVDIRKRIPAAAGLAGGSGNAAAVILALNTLWKTGSGLDELMDLGAGIGADVPFCMMGQAAANRAAGLTEDPQASVCALAEATGTELKPLPRVPAFAVLSKPGISVSTKEVYEGMDRISVVDHPDTEKLTAAIQNQDFYETKKNMKNVLELFTLCEYDMVLYTKNKMQENCSGGAVLMSGSGPTVFLLTDDKNEADIVYNKIKDINKETFLTETI